MIDELVEELKKNNVIISVCSFDDCRKIKLYNVWYDVQYDNNYKHYSHSICENCFNKHYKNDI